MGQIRYLDLNEVELFGWESQKNSYIIESMIRGIELGDRFPEVYVHELAGQFLLSPTIKPDDRIIDGGHHRAVAHFIANTPLRVRVLQGLPRNWPIRKIVAIPEIKLFDDLEQFHRRRKMSPIYRPLEFKTISRQ